MGDGGVAAERGEAVQEAGVPQLPLGWADVVDVDGEQAGAAAGQPIEGLADRAGLTDPAVLQVGPFVRVPTIARWIRGSLPQVYRLHIPEQHVRRCYPEEIGGGPPAAAEEGSAR